MDDFSEYMRMKGDGAGVPVAHRHAIKTGLDECARIRMLREVFGLTLVDAKEVVVCDASGAKSLTDHQERMLAALKNVLEVDHNPGR